MTVLKVLDDPKRWRELRLKFVPSSELQLEDDSYEVVGHPSLNIQVFFEGGLPGSFGVGQEHPDGTFTFYPESPTLEHAVKLCATIIQDALEPTS